MERSRMTRRLMGALFKALRGAKERRPWPGGIAAPVCTL
jgi:hypothetical protein